MVIAISTHRAVANGTKTPALDHHFFYCFNLSTTQHNIALDTLVQIRHINETSSSPRKSISKARLFFHTYSTFIHPSTRKKKIVNFVEKIKQKKVAKFSSHRESTNQPTGPIPGKVITISQQIYVPQ